jgi:hypothetical protein
MHTDAAGSMRAALLLAGLLTAALLALAAWFAVSLVVAERGAVEAGAAIFQNQQSSGGGPSRTAR